MKWFERIALAMMISTMPVACLAAGTAHRSRHPVGFQTASVETASGPMSIALWYPTSATPRPKAIMEGYSLDLAEDGAVDGDGLPFVVLSHGNGAGSFSHVDLAMELASAGYVVASPAHVGDNFADQSRQGDPALFSQRTAQLRATIDHVLSTWTGAAHVDPDKVGAFGFSAGAFTVLGSIGGVPDMSLISDHCRRQPEFICEALAHVHSPLLGSAAGAVDFVADDRIKAAVVAAPGLGFTFGKGGLAKVRIPVQVWSGSQDTTVPFESNTRVVLAGLGGHAVARQLEGASHLSFLAPCGKLGPPAICSDPDGFDRESAHRLMNAEVIGFFSAQLAPSMRQ
jgi:predicted dienelactone hydrolase